MEMSIHEAAVEMYNEMSETFVSEHVVIARRYVPALLELSDQQWQVLRELVYDYADRTGDFELSLISSKL